MPSSFCPRKNKLTDLPEVQSIAREVEALNASLKALTHPESKSDAQRQVRAVWGTRGKPTTTEDFIISVAMAKVLGEPLKKTDMPVGSPMKTLIGEQRTNQIFETVGMAWVIWAYGMPSQAETFLSYLHPWVEVDDEEPGAVHRLILEDWARALKGLIVGDRAEAARYFSRAYSVGASFGTQSHPAILWTMAASLL